MSNASISGRASGAATTESAAAESPRQERFPQIESILATPEAKLAYGLVETHEGSVFIVRCGADLVHAGRAKGCIVEPDIGDTVLVARSEHHGSFVLSVLVGRTAENESVLAVDGNLTLRSKTGRVAIVGAEAVNVTSGGEIAVNAPSLVARTMSAKIFSDALSYVGRTLDAQVERMRVLGQALDTVIDVVSSRVQHSERTVEGLERVKVKEMHVNAEATLNLHGKNTLMTAEKIVKLDGEQIVIG